MKNSLTRRVIFGVTVANFEINYLNNEEVSEGTKNSSKVSRLCLIQWYVQNFSFNWLIQKLNEHSEKHSRGLRGPTAAEARQEALLRSSKQASSSSTTNGLVARIILFLLLVTRSPIHIIIYIKSFLSNLK